MSQVLLNRGLSEEPGEKAANRRACFYCFPGRKEGCDAMRQVFLLSSAAQKPALKEAP